MLCARDTPGRVANQGRARVWDRLVELRNDRPGAAPNLGVFRTGAWPDVVVPVRLLERHPASTQVFVPMSAARYLVVVAPPGPLDPTAIRAFLARGDQGVSYRPGTWHHPLLALDRAADFACLVWEDGTTGDCEIHPFEGPEILVP